jgi:hypothetical protein
MCVFVVHKEKLETWTMARSECCTWTVVGDELSLNNLPRRDSLDTRVDYAGMGPSLSSF